MSARNIILRSNVTTICTTDDPVDSLEWHRAIKADNSFKVQVLPAWRPDKAMYIEKPDYTDYLKKLEAVSGILFIGADDRTRLQYCGEPAFELVRGNCPPDSCIYFVLVLLPYQ